MPDRDDRLTTGDLSTDPPRERDGGARREDEGLTGRLREGADELVESFRGEPDRRDEPSLEGEPDREGAPDRREARDEQARDEPLMTPNDLESYQQRWEQVQTQFVDEPRRAVQDADSLVAEAMRQLADTFASERANLEEQWDRAGEVDTEALRVTLQRYRSFFDRLLSA